MKIKCEALDFQLDVVNRNLFEKDPAPYNDYIRCTISVRVTSFTGKFTWQPLRVDFVRFRDELVTMFENVGQPRMARLHSIEPGVDIRLHITELGQITGEYEFSNYADVGADHSRLTGSFAMDQTYLKPLIAEVDAVLNVQPSEAV